jgi:FtsZ-binding cell division protein ZapB
MKKQEKKIREHGTVLSQLKKTHEQEILGKNNLIEELKTKVGSIPQLQAENKTLREQNSCFTQEKLVLNSQLDKLTRDKNSIKFLHEKVQKDYAKLKTDFDQVNKLNSSYTDKLQNQENLNSRIDQLVQELGEFESVKAKLTDYQNRITEVENILADTNTKLIASQSQNASSISQINSLIQEIEINKVEFEKQRKQLVNSQAQNIILSKSVSSGPNNNGPSPKITNQAGKQDSRRKNQNLKINTNNLNQTKSYQETQLYSPEQIAQIQNLQQVYSIQQLKAYQNMCLSGQTNLIGSSNLNSPSPTYLLQQAVNQGINQGINQEYNSDLAQQYGPEYAQNLNFQQFNQEFAQAEQAFNQQTTDSYSNGYVTQQVTILYGEDGIPYVVDSAGNFIGYFDPNAQNYAC